MVGSGQDKGGLYAVWLFKRFCQSFGTSFRHILFDVCLEISTGINKRVLHDAQPYRSESAEHAVEEYDKEDSA